jgi:hypothetical protein
MRIIHYTKDEHSMVQVYSGNTENVIYIPSLKTLLIKKEPSVWGTVSYTKTSSDSALEEAKSVAKGKPPKRLNISYSKPREIEYDDGKLQAILENPDLKEGIEGILREIE